MADIKTRDAVKGTIKTIDKAAVASERMKSAYAKTKDKAEQGYYADESSATEYAADRVSCASERVTEEGVHQFNKQGQKSIQTTQENIGKTKDKIADFKQKRAAKAAEQRMERNMSEQHGLQIRHGTASRSAAPDMPQSGKSQLIKTRQQSRKTIKTTARNAEKAVKSTAKGSVKTAERGVKTAQATSKATIKTAEQTAKATKEAAKASAKAAQKAAQAAKATAKATAEATTETARAVEAPVLREGAPVAVHGEYCYDSYGGRPHGTANNLSTTVTRIVSGNPYPIHVGSYGWVAESQLQITG